MKAIKNCILLCLIIIIAVTSAGCGAGKGVNLYNIPFGTKYKEVVQKVDDFLSKEGYKGKSTEWSHNVTNYNEISVEYPDVNIDNYIAKLSLNFKGKIDEDKENSLFHYANYNIDFSSYDDSYEKSDTCYEYYFNKFKKSYGEPTEDNRERMRDKNVKWNFSDGTYCILRYYSSEVISFTYGSENVMNNILDN